MQHHQLLLTLSQQASKALYDASSQVPGADVGSDPSRAFMLADERLFSTVCMRVMYACHSVEGGDGGVSVQEWVQCPLQCLAWSDNYISH